MFKLNPDYKSRFRILKGGKISLVVSALLISSSLVVSEVQGADFDIANGSLTANLASNGQTVATSDNVTGSDYASVAANTIAADISINHDVAITNAGADNALLLIGLGNPGTASTLSIASGKTVSLTETDSIVGKTVEFVNGITNMTVTNSGTISTSITNVSQTGKAYVASIFFDGDADTVTITNSGAINTTFNDPLLNSYSGSASGVEFYSMNNALMQDITITNSRSINTQVNNTYVTPGSAAGASGFGIKMYAYSAANAIDASNISITNSGTLSVTTTNAAGRYADAKGIDIKVSTDDDDSSNYDATISNMSITNTDEILVTTVGSGNAFGINIDTDSYHGGNSLLNSTITNSGTITANGAWRAYGIYINSGDISGLTLTNQAGKTIAANGVYGANAINLSDMTDSTITNSGTLSASVTSDDDNDARTLRVGDLYGTSHILNTATGTITANAEDVMSSASAIVTRELGDTSIVENRGTITALAGGNAMGIVTSSVYSDAKILNSGTINVTSQGLFAYGSRATGIYVDGTLYGELTNSNAINVTALDGGANKYYSVIARGIDIESDVDGGQITNSGTITVTAAQNTDAYYDLVATGVSVQGNFSNGATITNTLDGIITVTHNDADGTAKGIYVSDMHGTSSISNAGSIIVRAGGDTYGISFDDGMYDTSSIVNSGTITVNTLNGRATAIDIGYTADTTTHITNSGTITATKNDVADYDAFSFMSANGTGTFNNTYTDSTHYGKLYGNINAPHSTLNNAGLISLPYNANSDTTTASVGTFVNNATGILEIGLLTDGTTTTHSQLATTNATFESGSTINVNVLAASTNVALLAGETLQNVVSATTALTINGTLNITDNSALLNFEYVEDGETIDLNIVEGTTLLDSTIAGGGSGNAQEAAGALQALQDAGTPSLTGFFSALGGLGSDAAVAQAVQSTTPVTTVSNVGATTQIMNGIQGIVEQRQGVNVGGGLNSGEAVFAEKNFWFKPYGSWGSQDSKDGINGFDLKARGAGLGFDGEYAKDARLGFALFYTDARVEVNGMPQKSDLDVYTALVYGSVPVLDEKTKLLYQAGYSWQKTDASRYITVMNETAKADYTSKTASLDVKLLRDYKINSDLTLQPLVEATYRNFKSPSYSESGATTNLSVDSFKAEELVVGIGALAHYKIDDVSKVVANVNVGYDLLNDENAITSAYSVAPTVKFTTNGIDNGRWSYEAGVGYERQLSKESTINLMYNYEAQGSTFDNHSISARVQYKF